MNYRRKHYFIDKSFKSKFILTFCLIVFVSAVLTMGLLLYLSNDSNTVAIENTRVIVKTTADFILPMTVQTILISVVFSGVAVIALTLFYSHKISGPLFRLTREIEAVGQGDLTRGFQTRGNDQLQKFSQGLLKTSEEIKRHFIELKARHSELRAYLEGKNFVLSKKDKEDISARLEALERELQYFKTS